MRPEKHSDIAAIYCEAYATFTDACEKLKAGLLSKSGDRVITNPYVAIRDQASKTMLELSEVLGLSPGASGVSWRERPKQTLKSIAK